MESTLRFHPTWLENDPENIGDFRSVSSLEIGDVPWPCLSTARRYVMCQSPLDPLASYSGFNCLVANIYKTSETNHPFAARKLGISCPVAIGAPGSYALQIAEARLSAFDVAGLS